MSCLRPRARLGDVLAGRADLVGARVGPGRAGVVSPVEARLHLGLAYGEMGELERRYLAERGPLSDLGVLARVALSRLIPGAGQSTTEHLRIVDTTVDSVSVERALERITGPGLPGRARMVHFAHPHAITLAHRDRALRRRLDAADLVLPDGVGLQVAAALLGRSLSANVNGTDLLPPLCERLVAIGSPLVLVGGASGVAERCAARLREAHGGLQVPLSSHGFLDSRAAHGLAAEISKIGRCVVLVGMGSPLQEAFAWRYLSHLRGATVVTVGGLFDFYSGRIPRAPMAWRELGLEWLFRLLVEPERLARRYLLGIPHFLLLTMLQRYRQRRSA